MKADYTFDFGTLILFGFFVVLLPYIPQFLFALLSLLSNCIQVQEEVPKKEKTQQTKKEGFKRKPSRWDWKEYRRHRHEEAFVEASMWLSMGDD